MDLRADESLDGFRRQVRAAIAEDLPPDMRARQVAHGGLQSDHADLLTWTGIMAKRGWTVPHWPVELGGQDWSPLQHFVFEEELNNAYAPEMSWAGSHMVGPVIYTFGSEAQKAKFLPPIRNGDYIWAQGFSEPANGSDLANLRTSAVRRGEVYLVNGQKIWTSGAFAADWGFFLVRTDPAVKAQRGISFLLIKLDSPGITIRRIPQINGEADLCEVFLDQVEVPIDQLVGEPGAGWGYAKFLLDRERTTSSFIYFNKRELRRAKAIAEVETLGGTSLARVPEVHARIARIEAELTALEWSVLRTLAGEEFGYHPTAVASVLKVAGSKLQQAISELQVDLIGAKSMRYYPVGSEERLPDPHWAVDAWPEHVPGRTGTALGLRASTIYGGTLQVQKNIIAKLAFGL
ncbi:MAG: acyl-CoA dehydrogenase family protein [Sphingomicrobium sp.]